jgi:hypothetical protein
VVDFWVHASSPEHDEDHSGPAANDIGSVAVFLMGWEPRRRGARQGNVRKRAARVGK